MGKLSCKAENPFTREVHGLAIAKFWKNMSIQEQEVSAQNSIPHPVILSTQDESVKYGYRNISRRLLAHIPYRVEHQKSFLLLFLNGPKIMLDNRGLVTLCLFCLVYISWGLTDSIQAPFYPIEATSKGASPTEYGLVSIFSFYLPQIYFHSCNGPQRLSISTRWQCIKGQHCNLKQNMCLCSKQSSLFSFYALPSGGKLKDAVVLCGLFFFFSFQLKMVIGRR